MSDHDLAGGCQLTESLQGLVQDEGPSGASPAGGPLHGGRRLGQGEEGEHQVVGQTVPQVFIAVKSGQLLYACRIFCTVSRAGFYKSSTFMLISMLKLL